MAEAIARRLAPPGVAVYSAGSAPSRVNPLAVEALAEIGLDATAQRSKGLDAIPLSEIDVVVTLCAEEVCPVFPGNVERIHWPLEDPAGQAGFRKVRDELGRRIALLLPHHP